VHPALDELQGQVLAAASGRIRTVCRGRIVLDGGPALLQSAASFFPDDRRSDSRTRQAVIDENPALQERELHKFANLAATLADALRRRGVEPLAATLAARTGTSVFAIAFAQWIGKGEHRSLNEITTDVLGELRTLTAKGRARSR
jgi:hypothetical protein